MKVNGPKIPQFVKTAGRAMKEAFGRGVEKGKADHLQTIKDKNKLKYSKPEHSAEVESYETLTSREANDLMISRSRAKDSANQPQPEAASGQPGRARANAQGASTLKRFNAGAGPTEANVVPTDLSQPQAVDTKTVSQPPKLEVREKKALPRPDHPFPESPQEPQSTKPSSLPPRPQPGAAQPKHTGALPPEPRKKVVKLSTERQDFGKEKLEAIYEDGGKPKPVLNKTNIKEEKVNVDPKRVQAENKTAADKQVAANIAAELNNRNANNR